MKERNTPTNRKTLRVQRPAVTWDGNSRSVRDVRPSECEPEADVPLGQFNAESTKGWKIMNTLSPLPRSLGAKVHRQAREVSRLIHGAFLAGVLSVGAAEIPPAYAERICTAIYWAEGGAKARVPYGILSVKVKDAAEARRVCLRTIRNNWRRWEKAGRPGAYLDFLADRYCPPSVDPTGNRNWRRNVRRLMR